MSPEPHPAPRPPLLPTLVCVATLALGTAACSGGDSRPSESLAGAAKLREPARVLAEPIVRREMVRVLETTTRVESEQQVEVFPRASGVVTAILFEEGDRVRAGEALAKIDDREARISLSEAEVALAEAQADLPKLRLAVEETQSRLSGLEFSTEQAQRDYDRNVAISRGGPDRPGLISQTELEAKRLGWDTARAESETAKLSLQRLEIEEKAGATAVQRAKLTLESARLALSYTEITAPFDGVVAERLCNAGDTCTAGAAAFVLTDPDRLRAVFFRPQRELPLFRGATTAVSNGSGGSGSAAPDDRSAELELRVHAEALPALTFRGAIERIAPTIDPRSGNFRVTARLEPAPVRNPSGNTVDDEGPRAGTGDRLLPGMLVRLAIVTERRPDALVVKKRAIQREGDLSLVYVVRENVAVRVPVVEGLSDDGDVEITPLDGARLDAGELVIVVGHRDLEDGAAVSIELAGAAAGPTESRDEDAPAAATSATSDGE